MANFDIEVSYDGHRFRVKGSASPYVPARTNCSNDDAHPAEGGLEEISEITLLNMKGEPVELPTFLQEALGELGDDDSFAERVAEKLSEIEGDYE